MQPGGTRQTILVATALAAGAVLAAWWWLATTHRPDAANALTKTMRGGAAVVREAVASRESSNKTDAARVSPEADRPATESAPASNVVAQTGMDGAKVSSSTTTANISSNESNAKSPASADDETTTPDSAESNAGKSESDATQTNDASNAKVVPGSAIDADRVADMYAHVLEKIESGSDSVYASQKLEFQGFDGKEAGGESERDLEQALRDCFSEWISALPPDLASHVLLAAVDCHVGECRVLLAQNGVDFFEPGVRDPQGPLNLMQSAIWALLADGLPNQHRWNLISSGRYAAGGGKDGPLDTALWFIFVGVKDREAAQIEP